MSDFFVMPQYASLRGKLVLKTVIYIPPLFVSSQTKRAYYMLKKRLQIVCEDTNEGSEMGCSICATFYKTLPPISFKTIDFIDAFF